MSGARLREAGPDDAHAVARLHADSWRRHYRGAYSDSFLDGDVVADREAVWTDRLAQHSHSQTILAEDGAGGLVGFVHVVFDDDAAWGSLIDNLHVRHDRQRGGTGTMLMSRAAAGVLARAAGPAMYLWVLEQNTRAQRFYRALGASIVGSRPVSPPGGVPGRLTGDPVGLRAAWADATPVAGPGMVDRSV